MPQQDMSSKIGTSTSANVNSVIKNSADGQKPVTVPDITKTQFNKQPVSVPVKK